MSERCSANQVAEVLCILSIRSINIEVIEFEDIEDFTCVDVILSTIIVFSGAFNKEMGESYEKFREQTFISKRNFIDFLKPRALLLTEKNEYFDFVLVCTYFYRIILSRSCSHNCFHLARVACKLLTKILEDRFDEVFETEKGWENLILYCKNIHAAVYPSEKNRPPGYVPYLKRFVDEMYCCEYIEDNKMAESFKEIVDSNIADTTKDIVDDKMAESEKEIDNYKIPDSIRVIEDKDIVKTFKENEEEVVESVKENEEEVVESAKENEEEVVESAKEIEEEVVESAKEIEEEVIESAKEIEEEVIESAKENEEEVIESAKEIEEEVIESAKEIEEEVIESAKENEGEVVESAKEIEDGKNAVSIKEKIENENLEEKRLEKNTGSDEMFLAELLGLTERDSSSIDDDSSDTDSIINDTNYWKYFSLGHDILCERITHDEVHLKNVYTLLEELKKDTNTNCISSDEINISFSDDEYIEQLEKEDDSKPLFSDFMRKMCAKKICKEQNKRAGTSLGEDKLNPEDITEDQINDFILKEYYDDPECEICEGKIRAFTKQWEENFREKYSNWSSITDCI